MPERDCRRVRLPSATASSGHGPPRTQPCSASCRTRDLGLSPPRASQQRQAVVGDAASRSARATERATESGLAFGLPKEQSNVMTLVVLGTFVRALQRAAAAPGTLVRNVRSSPTAVGDTMIGAAVAKETVNSIAGHPIRTRRSPLWWSHPDGLRIPRRKQVAAPRGETVDPPHRRRGTHCGR